MNNEEFNELLNKVSTRPEDVPLRKGFWYIWNKETDEITDAADCHKTYGDLKEIFEGENVRRVAGDQVGKYYVSTVFLGLDHNFDNPEKDISKGLWFETMIFEDGEKPRSIEFQKRYGRADEARIGHQKIVDRLKIEQLVINWDAYYE